MKFLGNISYSLLPQIKFSQRPLDVIALVRMSSTKSPLYWRIKRVQSLASCKYVAANMWQKDSNKGYCLVRTQHLLIYCLQGNCVFVSEGGTPLRSAIAMKKAEGGNPLFSGFDLCLLSKKWKIKNILLRIIRGNRRKSPGAYCHSQNSFQARKLNMF